MKKEKQGHYRKSSAPNTNGRPMWIIKVSHALASIELFIAWCIWLVIGFFAGYLPGWEGGGYIWRSFEMQKYFATLPYEKILDLAKGKYKIDTLPISYSQEEITFYAFMLHPKIRHGLHSIIAGIILCIIIAFGIDWLILYILIAASFLFGIVKITQGSMDILH